MSGLQSGGQNFCLGRSRGHNIGLGLGTVGHGVYPRSPYRSPELDLGPGLRLGGLVSLNIAGRLLGESRDSGHLFSRSSSESRSS